jgi:hypothetical protein
LGCSAKQSPSAKYGFAYNSERTRRGIPVIKVGWVIQDMGSFIDCFDPKPNQTKPHRLSKRVFVDAKGIIIKEVDTFYSGQTFISKPPEQTKLPQEIVMEYQYGQTQNPWKATANLGPDRFCESITIEEADRLLASWGLSRQDKQ